MRMPPHIRVIFEFHVEIDIFCGVSIKDAYQSARGGTVYVSDPYHWFEHESVGSHAWATGNFIMCILSGS